MAPLQHKLAVITGGGSGIGRAIAHRFALDGATCVLVGRDPAKLHAAVAALPPPQQREASQHAVLAGDVQQAEFWDQLGRRFRSLDILVNAAGVAQNSLLVRTGDADVERIVGTNLVGTALGCRQAAGLMMRRGARSAAAGGGGCIINVSSVLAVKRGAGASVYAASKAGVLGLTRSLAVELGRYNIRVNALVPGYIDTPMTSSPGSKLGQSVIESIPLNRMGSVDEVADAAAFLAQNQYAHGCILNLDGGLSAT